MVKKLFDNRLFILYIFPFFIGSLTVLSFQPFNYTIINFIIFPLFFYTIVYISKKSQSVLKIGKEAFHKQAQLSLEDAYDFTSKVMTQNMMMEDAEEGINSFIEKRDPDWKDK